MTVNISAKFHISTNAVKPGEVLAIFYIIRFWETNIYYLVRNNLP